MKKVSRKTIEILRHFLCAYCKKWWSIGDAHGEKEKWFCPWCGKENKYKKSNK